MKIVVLIDIEALPGGDPRFERLTRENRQSMEYGVVESLRELKHEVEILTFGPDIVETIHRLLDLHAGLVFNLTEHFGGDRRRDMNVAALLDLLAIPYTGSGPDGLLLCRDKAMCKRVLSHHRIRIPQFAAVPIGQGKPRGKIPYPMIVKPMYEDGSDGISLASLVHNEAEMAERVRMIHERMKQPAICEEYVDGREIYIGVVGNDKLVALPPREIRFGRTGEGGPNFATSMVKGNEAYRKKWEITYGHADLAGDIDKKAARLAKRVYRLLQMRGYGRIDLRVTPENECVFLEANPNPDLARGEDMAEAAAKAGISYTQLVDRIVRLALRG